LLLLVLFHNTVSPRIVGSTNGDLDTHHGPRAPPRCHPRIKLDPSLQPPTAPPHSISFSLPQPLRDGRHRLFLSLAELSSLSSLKPSNGGGRCRRCCRSPLSLSTSSCSSTRVLPHYVFFLSYRSQQPSPLPKEPGDCRGRPRPRVRPLHASPTQVHAPRTPLPPRRTTAAASPDLRR
jgi:hypothetical protein